MAASAAAAAAQSAPPSAQVHHSATTKIPLLSRIFRFACGTASATTPFILAQVTSTWNETLNDPEWGCADALFESLADADNTNLSEQQVKNFWNSSVLALKAGKNPELVASLDRAIDKENQKAAAEFAAGNPAAVAKHRLLQQHGTVLVAFRNCPNIPPQWGWNMDSSQWQKIKLDNNDRIQEIRVNSCQLTGTVAIDKMPPLDILDIGHNNLEGTLQLGRLPPTIARLGLNNNKFTGNPSADFGTLPSSLKQLHLNYNLFSGKLHHLRSVPSSLRTLDISNNPWSC